MTRQIFADEILTTLSPRMDSLLQSIKLQEQHLSPQWPPVGGSLLSDFHKVEEVADLTHEFDALKNQIIDLHRRPLWDRFKLWLNHGSELRYLERRFELSYLKRQQQYLQKNQYVSAKQLQASYLFIFPLGWRHRLAWNLTPWKRTLKYLIGNAWFNENFLLEQGPAFEDQNTFTHQEAQKNSIPTTQDEFESQFDKDFESYHKMLQELASQLEIQSDRQQMENLKSNLDQQANKRRNKLQLRHHPDKQLDARLKPVHQEGCAQINSLLDVFKKYLVQFPLERSWSTFLAPYLDLKGGPYAQRIKRLDAEMKKMEREHEQKMREFEEQEHQLDEELARRGITVEDSPPLYRHAFFSSSPRAKPMPEPDTSPPQKKGPKPWTDVD